MLYFSFAVKFVGSEDYEAFKCFIEDWMPETGYYDAFGYTLPLPREGQEMWLVPTELEKTIVIGEYDNYFYNMDDDQITHDEWLSLFQSKLEHHIFGASNEQYYKSLEPLKEYKRVLKEVTAKYGDPLMFYDQLSINIGQEFTYVDGVHICERTNTRTPTYRSYIYDEQKAKHDSRNMFDQLFEEKIALDVFVIIPDNKFAQKGAKPYLEKITREKEENEFQNFVNQVRSDTGLDIFCSGYKSIALRVSHETFNVPFKEQTQSAVVEAVEQVLLEIAEKQKKRQVFSDSKEVFKSFCKQLYTDLPFVQNVYLDEVLDTGYRVFVACGRNSFNVVLPELTYESLLSTVKANLPVLPSGNPKPKLKKK